MIDEAKEILPPKLYNATLEALEAYSDKLQEAAEKHGVDVEVLKKEVRRRVLLAYKRAVIEPGEPIGTVTAQSLGEPTTQMVLRTFHFAGIAKLNVTLGLPRLQEIMNVSKKVKTPIMTVYLKKKRRDRKKLQEIAVQVQSKIEKITLRRLTKEVIGTEIVENYKIKEKNKDVILPLAGIMRVEIDEEALKARGLSLNEVIRLLKRSSDVKEVKLEELEGRKILTIVVAPKNKTEVGYDDIADILEKIYNYKLFGMESIKRGIIERSDTLKEFVLRFEGSNMLEVMKIPDVDETRVTSNLLREIEEVLGIEAARNALIYELRYTMKESGNLYVDVRHYMLLADAMSHYGTLQGITRNALVKHIKKSPIGKAAFEIPYRFLADASRSGERDPLSGVNESIIVGNLVKLGTGKTDVMYNLFGIAKFKEEE